MAKLNDLKITGRTSASVDGTATGLIATQAVEYHSDNRLRWTDSSGIVHSLECVGEVAHLLSFIFTGAGGVTTAWLK